MNWLAKTVLLGYALAGMCFAFVAGSLFTLAFSH